MSHAYALSVIYSGGADGGEAARQAAGGRGERVSSTDTCAAALGTASAASVQKGRDDLVAARLCRRVPRMIV